MAMHDIKLYSVIFSQLTALSRSNKSTVIVGSVLLVLLLVLIHYKLTC